MSNKPFVVVNSFSLVFEGHDGPELLLVDQEEMSWEDISQLLQDCEEEAYASSCHEEAYEMSLEEYEALCASCEEDEDD